MWSAALVSISVDVYLRNESGNLVILTTPPEESDLVGHDDTRHTLWGSPAVRAMGATVVVGLAGGDVWVGYPQLDELVDDCELILKHLAEAAVPPGRGDDYIRFRVGNLRAATERARAHRAGVVIWAGHGDLVYAARPAPERGPGGPVTRPVRRSWDDEGPGPGACPVYLGLRRVERATRIELA